MDEPKIPRGARRYDILREEEAMVKAKPQTQEPQPQQEEIFRATIIAHKAGGTMNEEGKFIYELLFKPNSPDLKLRPEDTQTLLSYFEEMLKQIEGN